MKGTSLGVLIIPFGGSNDKDYRISGSMLGSPYFGKIPSLAKSYIQQSVLAGARRLPQALSVNAAWLVCSRLCSQRHELRYVMEEYI